MPPRAPCDELVLRAVYSDAARAPREDVFFSRASERQCCPDAHVKVCCFACGSGRHGRPSPARIIYEIEGLDVPSTDSPGNVQVFKSSKRLEDFGVPRLGTFKSSCSCFIHVGLRTALPSRAPREANTLCAGPRTAFPSRAPREEAHLRSGFGTALSSQAPREENK